MHTYEVIFLTFGNQKVLTHTSTHILILKGEGGLPHVTKSLNPFYVKQFTN